MTAQKAKTFTEEWIAAWNSHHLDEILEHYSDEIEFTSPLIIKLFGEASGTIRSKKNLRLYFQKGLQAYPELHFELLNTLVGVDSIVLHYHSVNDLTAAETMHFDSNGKVCKVAAHYASR